MKRIALIIVLFCAACGSAGSPGSTLAGADAPEVQDAASFAEARRVYFSLPDGDPERESVRAGLLAWLGGRTDDVLATRDYDALVAHVESMADLFRPAELVPGSVPRAMAIAAEALRERGERLGDEGRVLGALYLLRLASPDDASLVEAYEQVARFSTEARASSPSEFDSARELVEVYQAHAELSPSIEVLDALTTKLVAWRDAAFAPPGERFAAVASQVAALTPLEVAGVYLARESLDIAIERVRALGRGAMETRVVRVLERAAVGGGTGASALLELAEAFGEGRPRVARGACRIGRRTVPGDARFSVCIAQIELMSGHDLEAAAYYAEAIERAPTERGLYDEAVVRIAGMLERGIEGTDRDELRALAATAERIIAERNERFPGTPSDLPQERLELLFGVIAETSGDPDEAARRFEASVRARPTPGALIAWGVLLERLDRGPEALRKYREALDLVPEADVEARAQRAEILEHMGDAQRIAGDETQSTRYYRQALELWDRAAGELEEEALAVVAIRRGIILDRLARRPEAREAFRAAIVAAPARRETYASILSYLASAAPDIELAEEVFATSRSQVDLSVDFRVYFSLWVRIVAIRAGAETPDEARATLNRLARGEGWTNMLARYAVGELTAEALIAAASNVGERCEAEFYVGTSGMVESPEAAAAHFRAALASRMTGFFEYQMAQTFLASAPAASSTETTTP
jgi:tetratricopeptide (TPR) repeat protein